MTLRLRQALFTLLALGPALVFAQLTEEPIDGIRVFYPSYYDEFDPVSALQLVFRTPGFNPQENDGGRGLANVRSNILIDGKRPPPKGQSIRQQLREMPVNAIERIELIDAGARLDIDMQGYPQVVNVITVDNPPAYYEVTTQMQRTGEGDVDQENRRESEVEASGSFHWRDHEFSVRGQFRDRGNRSPSSFVSIDPANPEQRITSLTRWDQENYNIQTGTDFVLPRDSSLSLTTLFSHFEEGSMPISLATTPDPNAITQIGNGGNDQRELSAEYRQPFGDRGELLVALVDTERDQQSESSLTDATTVRSSLNDRENGETAARILLNQSPTDQITVRTTATTAFNYFEGGFRLFENGVELPVQGSDNRVEEDRHLVESEVDWNLTERWNIRSSVGFEHFNIESRESTTGQQRTDPIGEFVVTFRPQQRTTFSIETKREIGQLSFNQFLASSSLSSEIVSAGAVVLEPERSMSHAAVYDRRFSDRGVLRVTLNRSVVNNPVRTVALNDSLTISQNTSPRTWDSLNASLTYPLERFGRDDLILSVDGFIASTETVDPVTGEIREVSGTTEHYWALGLRRDPGETKLAWQLSVNKQKQGDNFSVRTITTRSAEKQWEAMVEWEAIDRVKFRAELNGPITTTQTSSFFPAVRAIGLDPSFYAHTFNRRDRAMSFQVEWRRHDHLEIRAGINSQPKRRTEEALIAFGDVAGALLATEIAHSPRVWLRVRAFR